MPQTRARSDSDSSADMTNPKRRLVDPEKQELPVATLLNTEEPSHMATIKNEPCIWTLAEILEKSESDDFLSTAKYLLQILKDGLVKSSEVAETFSGMMRSVWQNPCFVRGLCSAIEKDPYVIGPVIFCSNHHSPTERIARMEADGCLKPFLMSEKLDTTTTTIIWVFVTVLIGHWTPHQGELRELDEKMGKNFFGHRMDLMAKCKAYNLALIEEKPVLEQFSYIIETASDAENMEPLRQQLVEKYGQGRLDLEAMLTRLKSDLLICVDIHKHLGYDGRKAKITITLNNGCYPVIQIHHFTNAS